MTGKRRLNVLSLLIALAALGVGGHAAHAVLWEPAGARANPASNLALISYLGDTWANYDSNDRAWDSNRVDWPLRFILFGAAEIDKVKNRLDGCGGDPSISPGSGATVSFSLPAAS